MDPSSWPDDDGHALICIHRVQLAPEFLAGLPATSKISVGYDLMREVEDVKTSEIPTISPRDKAPWIEVQEAHDYNVRAMSGGFQSLASYLAPSTPQRTLALVIWGEDSGSSAPQLIAKGDISLRDLMARAQDLNNEPFALTSITIPPVAVGAIYVSTRLVRALVAAASGAR